MSKETGGPAFPVSTGDETGPYQDGQMTAQFPGITTRDYFAAKAMQSYLLSPDRDNFTFEQWSSVSYEMADAMIAERSK